ncbi:MAG: zeta toxin family protein [Saccharofermentans sp.]|nr:zeta toxin family protein [Saccharofermentans sp.]
MDNALRKPMLLCFAGPNGSGKSTITKFFEIAGEYTNADDVVSSTGMENEEAAKFVDKKRYDSIEAKSDLTFETVLSSKYKMDILRKSKAEGYFIKCVFVLTADPELNVARVESRVMQGGHDVDREKVKTRFYKSLANIKELMSLCDILHVYDNTDTPYRIIRKHKDSITIFPNEYWDEEDIIALITGTYSQRYIG